MTSLDKSLVCQIVAQLLLIDGAVTDEEHAFLQRLMDKLEMDDAARSKVFNSVNIDDVIEDKAALISESARATLLESIEEAALADGDKGGSEQSLIDRVRSAFPG